MFFNPFPILQTDCPNFFKVIFSSRRKLDILENMY